MLFLSLLVFIFLIVVRPQDFVQALMGTRLVLWAMVAMFAAWVLSSTRKDLFRSSVDRFAGVFLVMCVVSTISTRWLTYVYETGIEQLILALAYVFVVTIVDSADRLRRITWTLLAFMLVVAGMGILQAYGTDITGSGMIWAASKGAWQIRGAGLFDNPNDMAYSVVLIVPFAVGSVLGGGGLVRRAWSAAALATSLYCIYLTRSRGGLLALGTCLAFWFYSWIETRFWKRVAVVACAVAVVAAFMSQSEGYTEDRSAMGRVEAWAAGMDMLKSHPLIGVGKGQFIEFHERDSHSSYVRAGAETGLIGLYAYLGLLVALFLAVGRVATAGLAAADKVLKCGFVGYLGSYCVGSIFSTRTYDIVFLVVAGLMSAFARMSAVAPEKVARPRLASPLVLAITGGCLIVWQTFLWLTW